MMYSEEVASVTQSGIAFNKCHYACELALREQWFSHCSVKIGSDIPILYHPDDDSFIIIEYNEERLICGLINHMRFEGEKLTEYYEALECLKVARKRVKQLQSKYRRKVTRS